jgi:hemolysin type calcium-binding protein
MVEEIVINGHPQTAFLPFNDFFDFNQLFWTAGTVSGGYYENLLAALNANPDAPVSIAGSDKTPKVQIVDNDEVVVTGRRVDNVTTLIGNISKNSDLSREMQEWHDHNVTWRIEFLTNSEFDAQAAAHGKPGHDQLFAFSTYSQAGNHVADNSTVTTYVLKSEGTGSTLSTDIIHELLHYTRDSSGAFLYNPTDPATEGRIQNIQDGVFNQIFHSRTVNLDGSATNSQVITAPGSGSLVYGTGGNDVITAISGNNTIVAYNSNDILLGGSGNDFYKILGSGAKLLSDNGGSNSVYVPWAHSFYDFKTVLGSDGTLYLAPASSPQSADQSSDRIIIPDWTSAHFASVQYTNTSGNITGANIENLLAGEHGGGHGHAIVANASSDGTEVTIDTPADSYNYVVGAPLPGYYDPYAASASGNDQAVGRELYVAHDSVATSSPSYNIGNSPVESLDFASI